MKEKNCQILKINRQSAYELDRYDNDTPNKAMSFARNNYIKENALFDDLDTNNHITP
jgi:hypothetical protein